MFRETKRVHLSPIKLHTIQNASHSVKEQPQLILSVSRKNSTPSKIELFDSKHCIRILQEKLIEGNKNPFRRIINAEELRKNSKEKELEG